MGKVIVNRAKKVIYQEGKTVIKLFDKEFSKADILNEALNQARVEETGLNIPKIIEIKTIDGKWAIVMDYIKGTTLDELIAKNPNKLNEYLNLFTDLQISVHSKRVPRLTFLKDKMDRKVNLAADVLDATLRYDLHSRIDMAPKHEKVCHCDFVPSNIIIAENGNPYIIDWSHATQGNASADVAITYLEFCIEGKQKIADKYLDLFCKKSDTAKQYVQSWMPVAAASKISLKQDEKTKELLMKFINVVDGL
jgi:tRNA A-37 threonylcarbamoyl transferase component Bud32